MNNKTLPFLILLVSPVFFSYHAPIGREVKNSESLNFITPANEKYIIDKKESVMIWKCAMVFAGKGGHYGYVSVSKGDLIFEKDELVGGMVEIDMNTIADEHHSSDNGLVEHLKSADFFDVTTFPNSTFAINKVTKEHGNVNVTGNLTIKGITNEISFPAVVEVKEGIVNASGKVTIDRAKWDVRYGSGKFFSNLADEAISDEIEFEMKVVARK